MRRCWLLLVLLALAACRGGAPPPDSLAPTQTRAAELAELNRIPGTLTAVAATQTRLAELPLLTEVAATSAALGASRTPSTPAPAGRAPQPSPTARAANLQLTPTVTPIRVTVPATSPARRATPTKAGVPPFFDLVVDEARGRLYGSDSVGGRVVVLAQPGLDVLGIVDLGQASEPVGMALSPDGSELAIALNGFGNIALVDPESLKLTKRLLPTGDSGANQPYDVRYGGPRLLYSTGNPGSGGFDYIHVFDTETGEEVGRSTDIVRAAPRLAVTADGSIFVGESAFSPQQLYRYALKDNTPVQQSRGPHGPVSAADLAVRADGSAVYTAGGQVWSGNLQSQLGAFTAKGTRIEYVPATERLFVCQEAAVAEVEAQGNYNVVATHRVSATPRVARANQAGTVLYVSTDAGLDVIQLAARTGTSR